MTEENRTVKIDFNWFWPSLVALFFAMMHYGYSCSGCFQIAKNPEPAAQKVIQK